VALVGAIGGLVLGRHIDAGRGKRAVWYASATVAAIIVLRALETGSTTAAVVANARGFLGGCLAIPTLMTAVYTQAKRSPRTLRFQEGEGHPLPVEPYVLEAPAVEDAVDDKVETLHARPPAGRDTRIGPRMHRNSRSGHTQLVSTYRSIRINPRANEIRRKHPRI
jgi:hypothetical protein